MLDTFWCCLSLFRNVVEIVCFDFLWLSHEVNIFKYYQYLKSLYQQVIYQGHIPPAVAPVVFRLLHPYIPLRFLCKLHLWYIIGQWLYRVLCAVGKIASIQFRITWNVTYCKGSSLVISVIWFLVWALPSHGLVKLKLSIASYTT